MQLPLLDINHLSIAIGERTIVRNVSLRVHAGERLGIIGESGSGKSLTCLAILGLLPSGGCATGSIRLAGTEVIDASPRALRGLRGTAASYVFQEPQSALDPLMKIGAHLTAPTRVRSKLKRGEETALARRLAASVGLPDPDTIIERYPHELSGGQRQRVMIAMAMSTSPGLLVADEPTTALDVTVQSRILELMRHRTEEQGTGAILVTHDMAVAATWCQRIVVMQQGEIVETGTPTELIYHPQHPYTRSLVNAAYATSWQPRPEQVVAREMVAA